LAGAIGALGGVLVNLAFRQSFLTLKNAARLRTWLHCVLRAVLSGQLDRLYVAAAWRLLGV
jgi:hypothetical protein